MNVNIKDIAKLAGVGIATVSRVINNSGPVREDTREKVLEIIAAHHYVPNNSARNLKITRTKNIALLVKDITNPFFNKMIRVIEQKTAAEGYPLMIQNVNTDADELDMAIQEATDRNLCGVIIMGGSYSYPEEKFRRLAIPCVLLTVTARPGVDPALYGSVTIDDEAEGYLAAEYLISLGHRRIGFIFAQPPEPVTPNSLRYEGYLRALREHNIPFDPDLAARDMPENASGYAVGFHSMTRLYRQNRDITAVFAFADILAIGAAKAALSLGLGIPDDISILGFDGIEMTEYYQPPLDTVHQPAAEMALAGVEILFDMIRNNPSRHLVFKPALLKRGSCCKI